MSRNFDIAILGSGLGGLVSANILSKNGYKVAVLERNNHPGGCLQSFRKNGALFDTGIHYVGALDEGQILNRLFRYLNLIPGVSVRRLDEDGFERFLIGEKEYYYPMGYGKFEYRLSSYFPHEKEAIKKYISKIREIADSVSLYNLKEFKFDAANIFNKFDHGNLWQFIQSLTPNTELQQLFAANNALHAGSPEDTFLYVHAMINNHYLQSAWRFVDGSKQVADRLVENLLANGGELFTGKEVVRLAGDRRGVRFAQTSDGDEFRAKNYIATMHPGLTMEMLDNDMIRKAYSTRVRSLRNTTSVFTLYLTFEDGKLPYMNRNTHYFPNGNVWALSYYKPEEFPQNFGFYPIADNIDQKFTRAASVLSFMSFSEVEQWAGTSVEQRGANYEEFKELRSQQMIDQIERAMPGIRPAIKSYSSATPLTLRDYTATCEGAIYGIKRDSRSPYESVLFPQTKIPNLYLAGQNLSLHGMLGTTMGALLTSGEFCDLNTLIREINHA
jgi:all-trans-retinol 13,14-reductase